MEAIIPVLGALPYAPPDQIKDAHQAACELIDAARTADAEAAIAADRVRQAEREDRDAVITAARKGKDHIQTVPRFQVLADDARTTARQAARRAAYAVHAYRAAVRAAYDDPAVRDAWLAEVMPAYDQAAADARTTYIRLTEQITRKQTLTRQMAEMTSADDTTPRHLWGNPEALGTEAAKLINDPAWMTDFRQALADTDQENAA